MKLSRQDGDHGKRARVAEGAPFQQPWAPDVEAIIADVPNYTNTQPTVQVSEVKP